MPDAVADARPRHPMRLGEGAKAEHARVVRVHRPVRILPREVHVCLVEGEHDILGKRLDERPHPRRVVPGPHRIVGVGEVDERGPGLANRLREGVRILVVVAVGHRHEARTEARDMEVEGRVGAGRGHHRGSGLGQHPHHEAEQLVDAGPEADLAGIHPMMLGEERPEVVALRVAVPGDAFDRGAHGLGCTGRNPEGALVRTDANVERPAGPPLDGFGADEGDGRGKLPHDGAERNHGQKAGSGERRGRRIRCRRGGRGGGADRGRRARVGARCRRCATGR